MRAEPTSDLFEILVTTINVVAVASVAGDIGALLELQRQGLSIAGCLAHGASALIWSVELWLTSIWSSRLLLRSGHLNLASFIALLPMLSLLGITLLQRL